MQRGWPAYALRRIRLIVEWWRRVAEAVAKACIETLGDKCVGVYVVGGVAENRVTVFSDIDVVVVVSDSRLAGLDTILAIKQRVWASGVPDEIPLDLKVYDEDTFQKLAGRMYKRIIKILERGRAHSDSHAGS